MSKVAPRAVVAAETKSAVDAHTAETTGAHGGLVASTDSRLTDSRAGLLVASASASTGPSGTTDPTELFSASVTAAAGDVLRLRLAGDMLNSTGSAESIQLSVLLGGTTLLATDAESFNSGMQRREWWLDVEVLFPTPSSQHVAALLVVAAATADAWTLGTTNQLGPGFATAAVNASAPVTFAVQATLGAANASFEMLAKLAVLSRLSAA